MDFVQRDRRCRRTIAAYVWNPSSWAMFEVFRHATLFSLLMAAWDARQVQGQLIEFAAFYAVTGVWVIAHLLGLAGAGAGAGLRLAAVALAGRIACEMYMLGFGFDTAESVYDAWPTLAPWVWFVRNVGLVTFAYGLSLTLFAVVADGVRRRRYPAWVPSLED